MRIVEILLPNGVSDRSISPRHAQQIDVLQKRMNAYVDKILSPHTSLQGKEFLKSRLRDDYYDLKTALQDAGNSTNLVAEEPDNIKYEVFDSRTGYKVSGPYSTRSRASNAADKLDLEFGGYRYRIRPVPLLEAVHQVPITNEDFDVVKELMKKPIPAAVAIIYLQDCIVDDQLNDELRILENTDPGRDIRSMIAEWFNRVMPDQMYHFDKDKAGGDMQQRQGILSPIHGYDPKMYKGSNDPITGDAYGSR